MLSGRIEKMCIRDRYIYKAAEEDKCFNPKMEYVEVDGVIVGKVK